MSLVCSQRIRSSLVPLSTALALALAAGCMTDGDLVDPELSDDAYLLDDGKGSAGGVVDKDDPPPTTFVCGDNFDYCSTDERGSQTIPSPRRVDKVIGNLQITSGRLRLRIFSAHAGDDRLLLTAELGVTDTFDINKSAPTAVNRHMRVVIDEVASGTSYNLWLNFKR